MDNSNLSNATLDWNSSLAGRGYPPVSSNWGFWVKFVLTPVIVLIGIIGNTLSLVVMRSKTLRHKSYSYYLSALAVFDTITLVTRQISCIDEYYLEMKGIPGVFQDFNDASCKIYNFLENVSYLMSSWLVVFMAIERLIAVCFPFRKVFICKQSGAAITISCLLGLICISQSFRLIMIEHYQAPMSQNISYCSAGEDYLSIYTSLNVYFYHWTLCFVIPVSTILFCNISVLYQVMKVRKEIKQNEKSSRYNRVVKKKHRTTCMLLLVSFTFIATLLPMLTLSLIIEISIKLSTNELEALTLFYSMRSYLDLCVVLSLINYAINFFIYVLSGKSFRFELMKIFKRQAAPRRVFTARSTRDEFIRL